MSSFATLLEKHIATYGPLCPVPEAYERDIGLLLEAHRRKIILEAEWNGIRQHLFHPDRDTPTFCRCGFHREHASHEVEP